MSRARSPYMEWAKTRPVPAIDLAGSNLLACSLDDLPGAREAVDIAGESPEGYLPLREEIARQYGIGIERVATAGGCSGAAFLVCAALLESGDEALVERPFYDPLPAAARLLGARVGWFDRRFEDGYDVDPEAVAAALTPKTRLLILSSPHNPSGALVSEESFAALGRLAEKTGLHVLVDEVYLDTVPGARSMPAALRSERFLSASSLTKAYGLASLRCGWAVASAELAQAIRRARDVVDVWAPMPSDRLSVLAFRNLDRLKARTRGIVDANLRSVSAFLSDQPKLEFVPPRATVAFPRLRGTPDAAPFVDRLWRDSRTAVTPGHFFGAPGHFRIAFGGEPSRVAAGLDAIGRCLGGA